MMTFQKNNDSCVSGKFTRFTDKELLNLSANWPRNRFCSGLTGVIRTYRRRAELFQSRKTESSSTPCCPSQQIQNPVFELHLLVNACINLFNKRSFDGHWFISATQWPGKILLHDTLAYRLNWLEKLRLTE